MDGCFGLVRKKHARLAIGPPLHRDSLFADQADVDNFIQGYSKDKQEAESVRELCHISVGIYLEYSWTLYTLVNIKFCLSSTPIKALLKLCIVSVSFR